MLLLLAPVSAYKANLPEVQWKISRWSTRRKLSCADSQGVVVVSFIFTRCPDVVRCAQQLKNVELELSERRRDDIGFVSITVDPAHDSPEMLLEYTQHHGVSWPHLTGTQAELEPVWGTFALVVQTNVIEAHVMEYQPGEASVTCRYKQHQQPTHVLLPWLGRHDDGRRTSGLEPQSLHR